MEAIRSRVGEALDMFQDHIIMASDNVQRIVRQCSDEGRSLAIRILNEAQANTISNARQLWIHLIELLERLKESAMEVADPQALIQQLRILFRDEISRNNAFFILIGLGFGTTGGFFLGCWLARPHLVSPIMKAISITKYADKENVYVCATTAPHFNTSTDVLVRVKATAMNRIDKRLACGYGQTLRNFIQRYDKHNPEFPLILGRSCAGIVEAVGKSSRSGLEIGDEVWLAAHWFERGVASELVVVNETRVSRKPFLIGFEGAASLPYSGSIALNLLEGLGLGENTSSGKRILIQDAVSPLGCVLSQLLSKWGAHVTTTCHAKAAPVIHELGASDIITFSNENFQKDLFDTSIERSNFINELMAREKFHFIFITTKLEEDHKFLEKFLTKDGIVIDAVEPDLLSDSFGPFMRIFLSVYVRLKKLSSMIFRAEENWGGPHLCHIVLERLAGYVNDETLKTVVDRVYNPQDVEKALDHICSDKSIGSTIVTFR